ncbi:MAG TPA: hypothetical protein VJY41_01570 [Prolixibacteraceae bacterium]|nr:hypothetical protein [Prolixibacteraceae bacterium]
METFFPPETFPNSKNCLFIVIYRNPFDWLRSLHLQPHHTHPSLKNISFSKFIRTEWQCIWDEWANVHPDDDKYRKEMLFERNPITGERFENVIQLRNAKIKAFELLKKKVTHIEYVRYEDLVKEPDEFLNKLAEKYLLPLKNTFENIITYKGITPKTYKPKTYNEITPDDLEYIMINIDVAFERKIGYSLFFPSKLLSSFSFLLKKMKRFLFNP